jgi:DNA-binding FadR family transcriptional regulator
VTNAFPDWLLYEALFRYPELLADSMQSTYQEHVAIVEALKQGDSDRAAQKSIEHLMESGKWLAEYLNIPAELIREKEEQVSPLMKKTMK